jgi:hypothetical protein
LQVETPSIHVLIEVLEVRIYVNWLEARCPAIALDEQFSEGGLAAPYVSGYCYMHN